MHTERDGLQRKASGAIMRHTAANFQRNRLFQFILKNLIFAIWLS